MDDLERYIEKRKGKEPEFTVDFESGYVLFRMVALVRYYAEALGRKLKVVIQ